MTVAGTRTITHWIDGRATDPDPDGRRLTLVDPAAGTPAAEVELAAAEVVDRAVTTAAAAFPAWSARPPARRAAVLKGFAEILGRRRAELEELIVAEQGKTRADAAGEVARGLETVELATGAPQLLTGRFGAEVSGGVDTYSLRQPLGVCAAITPFNFPVMIPLYMLSLALACGNTVVLKPSEHVPSAAVLLAEALTEAGLPGGAFSVVHGDAEAVDALLEHPGVAAVSFVGSTPVARHVYQQSAATGKRVQALGGAKNHAVVLPDAALDATADALVSAAYGAAGQRCMAVTVAVAVEPIGDELVGRLAERASALRIGPGADPASDLGPLITARARERVASLIERGVGVGAVLVLDGRGATVDASPDGHWIGPTLFDHVTPELELYREEIFGPVLVVVRVPDLDAALALLHASPVGNGSAVFTDSGAAARRFATEAPTGTVGVNVPIPFPVSHFGFGGWKASRLGDHGLNADAVGFYTREKVITQRWLAPTGVDLGFARSGR